MEIKEKETTLIIKNVPISIRQRFKAHCAEMNVTMKTALLRLMDLEVEGRILYSPIDQKEKVLLSYSDKMVRSSDYQKK